jgi:hypothetical protein
MKLTIVDDNRFIPILIVIDTILLVLGVRRRNEVKGRKIQRPAIQHDQHGVDHPLAAKETILLGSGDLELRPRQVSGGPVFGQMADVANEPCPNLFSRVGPTGRYCQRLQDIHHYSF